MEPFASNKLLLHSQGTARLDNDKNAIQSTTKIELNLTIFTSLFVSPKPEILRTRLFQQ